MSGKLIVFEGTDGSGKATQARILAERLRSAGVPFQEIDFPRYGNPFAEPARLYLNGALGARPEDVSACAASTLYAIDRYASYKEDWGAAYEAGRLILANRYTTSNAVHRRPSSRRRSARAFWTGSLTWNITAWACPGRIWCSILICRQRYPARCCAFGRLSPTHRRIFMKRTPAICGSAAKTRRRLCAAWAGGASTAPGAGLCAPRRISTGRSGPP